MCTCIQMHTHTNTHIHTHTHICPWCSHTKRTSKSQLAVMYECTWYSHSQCDIEFWFTSGSYLLRDGSYSVNIPLWSVKSSFSTYLFARFIFFCAVQRETRKGVSYTSVCSDFYNGWLVPLGIWVLISLKWNMPSLMCSVWHTSSAWCLGDNWEGRRMLNTVSGWWSLSSETSVKGVKDTDYYYDFFFLFFSSYSSTFFSSFFPFSPSYSSLEIRCHYIVQTDPNITPLLR